MFEHSTTQEAQTGIVTISDNSAAGVGDLLEFMYSGCVEKLDENAEELLQISEKYYLPQLKLLCERNLIRKLSVNNVCQLLALADINLADVLKKACFTFIFTNRKSVLKTDEWETLKCSFPLVTTNLLEWIMEQY